MTDDKRNRLLGAVTVNLILLLVILAAVVVYQLVYITLLKRNCAEIQQQIEQFKEQTENAEKSLEYYKSQEFLLDKAYEYGFVFEND